LGHENLKSLDFQGPTLTMALVTDIACRKIITSHAIKTTGTLIVKLYHRFQEFRRLFFMQAQHIIGYFNGFLLRSEVKKVLDPSKNPKKCQIIFFASIQKITSKTFRIRRKSVFMYL
jgi:hypothetical protein